MENTQAATLTAAPALGAELESLRIEAEGDSAAPAQAAQPAAPAPPDTAAEWRGAIELALGVLKPAYPKLETVYTDKVIRELADRIDAVALKHRFTAWQFFERWKEEIALGLFVVPLLRQTAEAMRQTPAPAQAAQAAGAGTSALPQVLGGDVVQLHPAGLLRPNS